MRPLHRARAGALAAALALPLAAAPAHADGVDDLPEISRAQLAESVRAIEPGVRSIEPEVRPVERKSSSGQITIDSDILFGFDKDTLTPRAERAVVRAVKDIPKGASVTITGYTDDVGAEDYNQRLSTKRAEAVETALNETRPDLDTTAKGRGSADPVAPNSEGDEDNPEGRAQNRRVEISHG